MGSRHVRILKAKCCAQVSWFSVPICARVSRYAIRSSASSLVPCRVLAPQHSSSYSASSYQSDCTDGQAAVSRLKNHSLRPRNSLWTSYWRYHRRPHPKPERRRALFRTAQGQHAQFRGFSAILPGIQWQCYRVSNLYATISATMLAKISSAGRDFPIIGFLDWRAADRPGSGLGRLWDRSTLPSAVGVRTFGSGASPTPPISL